MVTEYTTKDSGEHAQYDSGMRRDVETGKPRFDLIRTKLQPYEEQMIYRYAMLLARGAEKYQARNWEAGDSEVELDRAKSSLLRHTEQLVAGETDEDHAAAVWFNTQAIEYFRWRIARKGKKRNGSAKRRRKQREKAVGILNASEIHNAALKEAQQMRRRARIAEAAKTIGDESTPEFHGIDNETIVGLLEPEMTTETKPKPFDSKAFMEELNEELRAARDKGNYQRGAVGLFQFMDAPWSTYMTPPRTHFTGPWGRFTAYNRANWTPEQRRHVKKQLEKWGIDTSKMGL